VQCVSTGNFANADVFGVVVELMFELAGAETGKRSLVSEA